MEHAVTRSIQTTACNVKSVISLEKATFHITSTFDNKTPLADLLFSAANESLYGDLFLPSDFVKCTSYNIGED